MSACCCSLAGTAACKTCVNNPDADLSSTKVYVTTGSTDIKGIDWSEYMSDHEDKVNHPSHYNQGKYEVIDVIDDWKLDFELGNAIKYIARAGHKIDAVEDLKKAVWYVNREIEKLSKEVK